MATGDRAGAIAAARDAWTSGPLSTVDEAKVIGGFSTALTPADQDARMDMLLWQGATGAPQRQLAFVSPANRAVFAARLAFPTHSSAAAVPAGSVPDTPRNQPAFLALGGLECGASVCSTVEISGVRAAYK